MGVFILSCLGIVLLGVLGVSLNLPRMAFVVVAEQRKSSKQSFDEITAGLDPTDNQKLSPLDRHVLVSWWKLIHSRSVGYGYITEKPVHRKE